MSVAMESFSLANPNPRCTGLGLKRTSIPLSLRFESPFRSRYCRVSTAAKIVAPKGLGVRFVSLDRRSLWNRSVVAFAASHEESKHQEIEVEEAKDDLKLEGEGSEEAWKQTLATFKEQALKMQSVSQEAYKVFSKKAVVILKETSEQLKIQAEKATQDLNVIAKEISEEGKEYLAKATENSPEPVKEIVETFSSSTNDLNDISKVRDFYIGIPYGLLFCLGGFLSFMITGNISAIRFGVILGGALLALSISSLRSYKRGESFPLALKGQTAIAGILFLREIRLLFQRPSFLSLLMALISGAVVAFYLYRITQKKKQRGGSNLEHGTEI